jgi:hypothetical protein
MASATTTAARTSARRGRKATHDPEALLDLVAAVARAGVATGAVLVPEDVSMPVFNRAKLDLDRARGITDPKRDPERTPTADAIQMRFKELAGRKVPWAELVEVALRAPDKRTMWFAALGRQEVREDLTDALVVHALRRVAHELGGDSPGLHSYGQMRDRLVRQDRALHGDDGVLDRLLPTANQVLAYCGMSWQQALNLAELPAAPSRPTTAPPRPKRVPPMRPAQVAAFYAALNGTWPSRATLLHFVASCGIRMGDVVGGAVGLRDEAAELLRAAGQAPPTRTRGGGKGKRMTYRYPVDGVPGAPLRDLNTRRRQPKKATTAFKTLRRERALISVRVWLASTSAGDKRTRSAYATWAVGTKWVSATTLNRYGGFTLLKGEASKANAAARRTHGTDVPKHVLARAEAITAGTEASYAAGAVSEPEPVPFADALRTVLAGPHKEARPPKQ